MIHFFPRFSRDAAASPMGDALRALGVPHRIIASEVPQRYAHRLQLLVLGYPRLAWSALRTAVSSMYGKGPPPDAAVISSDVEALVFAFVRAMPSAAQPRLVFVPFIFTQRASASVNRARLLYYRFVMRRVSCAVCHSLLEVARYQEVFAGCGVHFVFVPWGGYVPSAAEIIAKVPAPPSDGLPRVVSAGKSGRDYPTLAKAVADLPCHLTIICNAAAPRGGGVASSQVEVLQDTFGVDYLARLMRADVVAVPLQVEDISAGQMVIIQAMALGRPLVVTRTPTIGDYLQHEDTALLVPRGDIPAMAAAIRCLLDDSEAAAALGRRAKARYAEMFSAEAHLQLLVEAVQRHCRIEA